VQHLLKDLQMSGRRTGAQLTGGLVRRRKRCTAGANVEGRFIGLPLLRFHVLFHLNPSNVRGENMECEWRACCPRT
jgi:hypothetical protein